MRPGTAKERKIQSYSAGGHSHYCISSGTMAVHFYFLVPLFLFYESNGHFLVRCYENEWCVLFGIRNFAWAQLLLILKYDLKISFIVVTHDCFCIILILKVKPRLGDFSMKFSGTQSIIRLKRFWKCHSIFSISLKSVL